MRCFRSVQVAGLFVVLAFGLLVPVANAQIPIMPPMMPPAVTQAQAQAAINAATGANAQTIIDKNIAVTGIAALPNWWVAANAIINDPNRSDADAMEAWMLATDCDRLGTMIGMQALYANQIHVNYTFYMTLAFAQFINPDYAAAKAHAENALMATEMADVMWIIVISDIQEIIDNYNLLLVL